MPLHHLTGRDPPRFGKLESVLSLISLSMRSSACVVL